jgi:hypothetical protein
MVCVVIAALWLLNAALIGVMIHAHVVVYSENRSLDDGWAACDRFYLCGAILVAALPMAAFVTLATVYS